MEQGFQEELAPLVDEPVHEPIFGGYDFVFVDELSPGQTCSICLVAMRDPVQTPCGHRFCEKCLLGTFRQGNGRICPQDRNPIPDTGGFFRDVAWERDILSLHVECKKNDRGCTWIGALRHYKEHFDLCSYEDVVCEDCEEEMQRRFLEDHMALECEYRIVQCEHCTRLFEFWRTENHEGEECTRFPLECPQQCGVQEIPREQVEFHVRYDCSMTLVVCPYEGAGCTFKDKRMNLNAHIEEYTEEHLCKTWKELIKTKGELKRINEIEGQVKEIKGHVERLQSEKEAMETSLKRKSELITDLILSEKKLKQEVAELTQHLREIKENDATEIASLKKLVLTIQTRLEAMQTKENEKQVQDLLGRRISLTDETEDSEESFMDGPTLTIRPKVAISEVKPVERIRAIKDTTENEASRIKTKGRMKPRENESESKSICEKKENSYRNSRCLFKSRDLYSSASDSD